MRVVVVMALACACGSGKTGSGSGSASASGSGSGSAAGSATGSGSGSATGSGSGSAAGSGSGSASTPASSRDLEGAPGYVATRRCPDTTATSKPPALKGIAKGKAPADPERAALTTGCPVPSSDLANAYNIGGLVHHKRKRYVQSEQFFRWALDAEPSHLAARYNLTCSLALQGRGAIAINQLEEIATAGDPARLWLGKSLFDSDLVSIWDDPRFASLVLECKGCTEPVTVVTSAPPDPKLASAFGVKPPRGTARWTAASEPFDRFSSLLADAVPDRDAYEPEAIHEGGIDWTPDPLPRTVREPTRFVESVGWWRPDPSRTLLVIPWEASIGPGHWYGFAVYNAVGGGVVPEESEALFETVSDCGGGEYREEATIGYLILASSDRELVWGTGCTGATGKTCRLRWQAGALRKICESTPYRSRFEE